MYPFLTSNRTPSKTIRRWPTGEQTRVFRYTALEETSHPRDRPLRWVVVVEARHKRLDKEVAEMPTCNDAAAISDKTVGLVL